MQIKLILLKNHIIAFYSETIVYKEVTQDAKMVY
jgi:hypothetical protein